MTVFVKRIARAAAALAIAAGALAPGTAAADGAFQIEYLGGAEGMVAPDEDLFGEVAGMMPGDEFVGAVDVRNSGGEPVALWFWADETAAEGSGDLLSQAVLQVVDMATEEEVYCGPLHPSGMAAPICLGAYGPGESAELAWSVYLPEWIGNGYQGAAAGVTWVFAAEESALPALPDGDWPTAFPAGAAPEAPDGPGEGGDALGGPGTANADEAAGDLAGGGGGGDGPRGGLLAVTGSVLREASEGFYAKTGADAAPLALAGLGLAVGGACTLRLGRHRNAR